jgi:arsenite oxidase large subunit
VPNLRGATIDKKKAEVPDEPHAAAGSCSSTRAARSRSTPARRGRQGERAPSRDQFRHRSGPVQRAVHYIAEKGWVDRTSSRTTRGRERPARRSIPPAAWPIPTRATCRASKARSKATDVAREAAEITGLKPEDIVKAAEWIAMPKEGGKRRRTMFAYEKGIIWGNDNYRTNGAW